MDGKSEETEQYPFPWKWEPTREWIGQGAIVAANDEDVCSFGDASDVHDQGAGWPPEENHLRAMLAAVNSYGKHCADPLAAAEGDLLGELVAMARQLAAWEADPDAYMGDLADLACVARAVLAKAGRAPK